MQEQIWAGRQGTERALTSYTGPHERWQNYNMTVMTSDVDYKN